MYHKKARHTSLVAVLAVIIMRLGGPSVAAQFMFTEGHGDMGIGYTPGESVFEPHWHLDAGSVVDGIPLAGSEEFEPGGLVTRFSGTANVGVVSLADALGVSTGYTAYRTGNASYPPNLGFGLEEVGAPGDWLDESITLTLTGFFGPGEMALSQTLGAPFNMTLVWFSSLGDGYTVSDNSWTLPVGGHVHLDWWFTEAGFYEVGFTWNGTYIGGDSPVEVGGAGTFGLDVVPEPEVAGLLVLEFAFLTVAFLRRRRLEI